VRQFRSLKLLIREGRTTNRGKAIRRSQANTSNGWGEVTFFQLSNGRGECRQGERIYRDTKQKGVRATGQKLEPVRGGDQKITTLCLNSYLKSYIQGAVRRSWREKGGKKGKNLKNEKGNLVVTSAPDNDKCGTLQEGKNDFWVQNRKCNCCLELTR